MKRMIIAMTLLGSFSALAAESYDNIVCQSSTGYSQSYYDDAGTMPWDRKGGCVPTMECAGNKLSNILATIPEAGQANYSKFFDEYVEVSKKRASKPTLQALMSKMTDNGCVGDGINKLVDCVQATACATIGVEYAVCKKVAYDQNTGKKIVTCPSGRVIRE